MLSDSTARCRSASPRQMHRLEPIRVLTLQGCIQQEIPDHPSQQIPLLTDPDTSPAWICSGTEASQASLRAVLQQSHRRGEIPWDTHTQQELPGSRVTKVPTCSIVQTYQPWRHCLWHSPAAAPKPWQCVGGGGGSNQLPWPERRFQHLLSVKEETCPGEE